MGFFTDFISEINNTEIVNVEDIDAVMLTYNLIKVRTIWKSGCTTTTTTTTTTATTTTTTTTTTTATTTSTSTSTTTATFKRKPKIIGQKKLVPKKMLK